MADILNTLTANIIRFADGERPSAAKFNAVNNYFSRSLADIATVIGDLRDMSEHRSAAWNSYDTSNTGRPLDILNLGRLIGPASNLNPKMIGPGLIQETIPAGTIEFKLKYKAYTPSINGYSFVQNTEEFTNNTSFKVLNNSILFSAVTTQQLTASYISAASTYDGGINYNGASFNVIPDPNQAGKLSVEFNPITNVYRVSLGNVLAQQSGISDIASSALVDASEYNYNKPITLPARFEVYNRDDTIEPGTICLKNITAKERYENATYKYVSQTEVDVTGVTLCDTDEYCLLVVGTDITTSIDDLRNKNFLHCHDGRFGESHISVEDLAGIFRKDPSYGVSSIGGDFPMYLHRDGYSTDNNANNGNNAMRGDLMLGNISFKPLDPVNFPIVNASDDFTSSSRLLKFSHPHFWISRILDTLVISSIKKIKIVGLEEVRVQSTDSSIEVNDGINIDAKYNLTLEGNNVVINTERREGGVASPSVTISNSDKINQKFYSIYNSGDIPTGYQRFSNENCFWLNKAEAEAKAYEYKIDIFPSQSFDEIRPGFKYTVAGREKVYFVTDQLRHTLKKYNINTKEYEEVSGKQYLLMVNALEDESRKIKRFRYEYLDSSVFIHYKKEIKRKLTSTENIKFGLWSNINDNIPEVFDEEELNSKFAYFSITGENTLSKEQPNNDEIVVFHKGNSSESSTIASSYNEVDISDYLKTFIPYLPTENFPLTGAENSYIVFPEVKTNFFDSNDGSPPEGEVSFTTFFSRHLLIKIEKWVNGSLEKISWLKGRQDNEDSPEIDYHFSEDSGSNERMRLNITPLLKRLTMDDDDNSDPATRRMTFLTGLNNGTYKVKLIRTFRDEDHSSLNTDVVWYWDSGTETIQGWAKDGKYNNSLAWVDSAKSGAEAALNMYRGVGNGIGYSSIGNNRHFLIIPRDGLPISGDEKVYRKFRLLLDGGDDEKGAYFFLKEDWDEDGTNLGYYNWREVVNVRLRYLNIPATYVEFYVNGRKISMGTFVSNDTTYTWHDKFLLTSGSNFNITEVIKFGYVYTTGGDRFNADLVEMENGVRVPSGWGLEGSYRGNVLDDVSSNTFTYHSFNLDLEFLECYDPFTKVLRIDIKMDVITKKWGAKQVNNLND